MAAERGGMLLANRMKGDIAQTLIKSLLVAARYRVIDFGVEKTVREVASLSRPEYDALRRRGLGGMLVEKRAINAALSELPDFVVMDHEQTMSDFVEVKYRESINNILSCDVAGLARQVRRYGEVVVVLVVGISIHIRGSFDLPDDLRDHVRCLVLYHDATPKTKSTKRDATDPLAITKMRCADGIDRLLSDLGRDPRDLWNHALPLPEVFARLDQDGDQQGTRARYVRALVSSMPTIFAPTSSKDDVSAKAAANRSLPRKARTKLPSVR